MRVVGFCDGQQKQLSSFMEKSESVSLKNCQKMPKNWRLCSDRLLESNVSEEIYCG